MQFTRIILWVALSASIALAQSPDASSQPAEQKGAKALFFDTESGRQVPSNYPQSPPRPPQKHATASAKPSQPNVPPVTGLRYYFELREPDGELLKVNAHHTFHSGDRMRMHITSNMDGELVIYQQQDDTPEERLFPSAQLPQATGYVVKGSDTVLPSAKSWFRFDQHPGQIHMTVRLSAQGLLPTQQPTANAPSTLLAKNDAEAAHDLSDVQKGSKALQIEADDTPQDASDYVVVDSRLDSKIPPGVVAVEITLKHVS